MKQILYIFGFLSLCTACSHEYDNLHQTWILSHKIIEGEVTKSLDFGILNFEEDTFTITNYTYPSDDYGVMETNAIAYNYDRYNQMIIAEEEDGLDTLHYDLSEDTLVLNGNQKVVLRKLPSFNLASKENELKNLLLSSIFDLNGDENIEFTERGEYLSSHLEPSFGRLKSWRLYTFEDELFLSLLRRPYNEFVHIREVGPDNFKGTLYGSQDVELNFKKTKNTKFDRTQLLGDWKEFDYGFDNNSEGKIFPVEQLHFQDSLLIIEYGSTILRERPRLDSLRWEMSRQTDWLVFSRLRNKSLKNQWIVKSLSQKELVVERIKKDEIFSSKSTYEREQKKFIRQ